MSVGSTETGKKSLLVKKRKILNTQQLDKERLKKKKLLQKKKLVELKKLSPSVSLQQYWSSMK